MKQEIKVKKSLLGKKQTVTLDKDDFDLLQQQALAYRANIDKLKDENAAERDYFLLEERLYKTTLAYNKERKITVLISSHILEELSKLATHYGFIDNGIILREMSAEELESACRKCMQVTVTDTVILARVLDKMGMEYSIIDDKKADIYAKPNITQLSFALAEEKCDLLSVNEHDESLESFYISLVGGDKHE